MNRPPTRVLGFVAFCLLMAGLAWWGLRWLESVPNRMVQAAEAVLEKRARELRDRFFAVANFQPQVRINERVIAETTSEIAEVAVLERVIEVEREFTHSWAGSTKRIRLRGKYAVKSGFNLLERFSVNVGEGGTQLQMPPATLLSVEQKELTVAAFENGFWNPISARDMETSVTALQQLAREKSRGMLIETEANFRDRLGRVLGEDVEIVPILP